MSSRSNCWKLLSLAAHHYRKRTRITNSIYRSLSLSVFRLALLRSLSSVFSVFGSLSLSFYLSYIQSIALNPHPYSVSAVHDLLLQRLIAT